MKIKNTNSISATSLSCLIYSPSGHGKTTLASTLNNKTLVVSLESGLLSLKSFSVDYIEIEGVNGVEKVNFLRSIMNDIVKSDYDNIYFDSLSELSQCFLEYAQKEYPDDKQTLKRYGLVKDMTVKFIKFMRDLNKNVFFTALEKTDKDEIGRRFVVPDLVGSISNSIACYFDLVFRLEVFEKNDEKVRALLTSSKSGVIAKDRSGKLEEYEQPNLDNIIRKIFS